MVYPYDEIEWNSFDTQICLGEFHKDSCSKTGQIIKVDYKKFGLYAGVPLLAVILIIILVGVCLRKRKRERKFKARNSSIWVDRSWSPVHDLGVFIPILSTLYR